MEIKTSQQGPVSPRSREAGFALLVAVIFVSVMLSFALLIGTLAYKQAALANVTIQSQYALYAADAALECALEKDRDGTNPFAYDATSVPALVCNGDSPVAGVRSYLTSPANTAVYTYRMPLNSRCADVVIYKYETQQTHGTGKYKTYVFSQGYSVACDKLGAGQSRFYAARGLRMRY